MITKEGIERKLEYWQAEKERYINMMTPDIPEEDQEAVGFYIFSSFLKCNATIEILEELLKEGS